MKRSDLKDVLDMFDSFALEHPDGHQKKKMNRYFVSGSRLCFAFEKNDGRAHIVDDVHAHIWCPMKVAAYVEGIKKIPYPASHLWTKTNASGEKLYGRHSGLKATKELRDIDLIRFTPLTLDDAKRIKEGLEKAAEHKIT